MLYRIKSFCKYYRGPSVKNTKQVPINGMSTKVSPERLTFWEMFYLHLSFTNSGH